MSEQYVNYDKKNEGGGRFIKGATILAVAGILSKMLGAVFRIPLTNLIGADGMSYYSIAYSVYSFFLIISTAGIPVAISRMVSERTAIGDHRNAHKTYKVSVRLMLVLGIVSFAICFFGADLIASGMGNPGANYSMMAIAPVLLLAPLVSSFRGYYQGQQTMIPTAVSEVTEQFARVCIGLFLSYTLIKTSVEYASAGATFGASAGSFMALVLLVIIYFAKRKSRNALLARSSGKEESGGKLLKEMLAIAIPITIGSAILPIMFMFDAMIIMNRLQATGWSFEMSKTLYGLIGGFCDPLISFPHVFTDAVAISLVPAVAAAVAVKNRENLEKNIRLGFKTMMIVSFPCMVGFIVMARPILYMLYPFQKESAEMAVVPLQIMAIGIVGISVLRTFSSALQGIGHTVVPVIHLGIGAVFKVVVTFYLVGIPFLNIKGASIGNVICYFIAGLLNYYSVRKYTGVSLGMKNSMLKPCISSLIMGVLTYAVYKGGMVVTGSNTLMTLASILFAVVLYFVLIFKTGCIDREEAMNIPMGSKIVRIADALHLTKR